MSTDLFGKPVADEIVKKIIGGVSYLRNNSFLPCLAVVRQSEDTNSLPYEKTIVKRGESLGISVKRVTIDSDVEESGFIETVEVLNCDDNIHGILVMQPLIGKLATANLSNLLNPKKDVDGITNLSMSALYSAQEDALAPATVRAVVQMLEHYKIDVEGKQVVVVGRSLIVGKPLSSILLNMNATVTIAHSKTKNLSTITRMADIVIVAAGIARHFGSEFFAQGQVVVDVGTNWDDKLQSLVGDVNYNDVKDHVSCITPVPKGVGSVTSTMIFDSLLHLIENEKLVEGFVYA